MTQVLTPRKKLYSVSPSQVSSYRQCPRLWFWSSVLNDRGVSSRANVLGDAVHKALEHYMQTGEVWPTVTLPAPYLPTGGPTEETFETLVFVQAAIDHLPPHTVDPYWAQFPDQAGYGVCVEQLGEMGTYEGGPAWTQYIDLVIAQPGDVGQILDYKTRSSFRYNKTPEELSHDVQLMSNARWLFLSSDYKRVKLTHLNLLTRGRTKCVPVSVEVTREQVEAEWERTLATIHEMEQWAAIAAEAEKLPPNTASCDMYGGCRKRPTCFPQPIQIRSFANMNPNAPNPLLDALLAGKSAPVAAAPAPVVGVVVPAGAPSVGGLLGSLLAPAAAVGNVAPAAPPAPPAAPAPIPLMTLTPPAPAPVVSSLSALLNPAKAAEPLPAVVPPSAFQSAAVAAGYPVDFKPTGGIVPPDAPPRTSTPEQIAAANPPAEEANESTDGGDEKLAEGAQGTGEKTRRKRRTKAEMEAARAAEAAAATNPINTMAAKIADDAAAAIPPVETPPARLQGLLAQITQAPSAEVAATQIAAQAPNVATSTDLLNPGTATASTAGQAQPPADPVVDQIKHRLNTPDPRLACPVKFVFVDCLPAKGWPTEDAPVDARTFWHAMTGNASNAANVADYRFIKYESKAYLSASVRTMLRGLPASIYVDSSIPDIQELLTAVIPYASLVVYGR